MLISLGHWLDLWLPRGLWSSFVWSLGLLLSLKWVIFFKFYFIFKLYIIVLVLPNIKMNPPQVYMCSPSWTLLPPPSPYHPSGSSQCTSPKHPVSWIEPGLATRFIHDIILENHCSSHAHKGSEIRISPCEDWSWVLKDGSATPL